MNTKHIHRSSVTEHVNSIRSSFALISEYKSKHHIASESIKSHKVRSMSKVNEEMRTKASSLSVMYSNFDVFHKLYVSYSPNSRKNDRGERV